jgi:hypothetical protein
MLCHDWLGMASLPLSLTTGTTANDPWEFNRGERGWLPADPFLISSGPRGNPAFSLGSSSPPASSRRDRGSSAVNRVGYLMWPRSSGSSRTPGMDGGVVGDADAAHATLFSDAIAGRGARPRSAGVGGLIEAAKVNVTFLIRPPRGGDARLKVTVLTKISDDQQPVRQGPGHRWSRDHHGDIAH